MTAGLATTTPEAPPGIGALARGSMLGLGGAVAGGILSFAMTVVVTRGSTPVVAGAFFIAVAVLNVAGRISHLGAEIGLVRFLAQHRARGQQSQLRSLLVVGLVPAIVMSVLAGALITLFAPSLGRLVVDRGSSSLVADHLRWFGLFVPVAALLYAVLGATRGLGTMQPTVLANDLVRPLGQLGLVAVVVWGGGAALLPLAYGVPLVVALVVAAAHLRAAVRTWPPAVPTRPWAQFWSFCAPRSVSGAFNVALQWLDVILVGALAGARPAAVYAATTRYLVIGTTLQGAVMRAFQPELSALLAREDHVASQRLFQTATAWSMMVAWPAYLALVVHASSLQALFGDAYRTGASVLVILSLAWLLGTALGPVNTALVLGGRSLASAIILGGAVVTNVTLNLVLIPRYGIVGAAWAWFASILVNNLLPLSMVWTHMRLHPFGRTTATVAALAVAAFAVPNLAVRSLAGHGPGATTLALLLSGAVYVCAIVARRQDLALPVLLGALRARGRHPEEASP